MKYNYKELEKEWLTGKYRTLVQFSEINKIPYSTLTLQTKKWNKKLARIDERAIEKSADKLAKMLVDHQLLGQKVQSIGLKALIRADKAQELDASNALTAIKTGADIERQVVMPKENIQPGGVTIVFQALKEGIMNRPVNIIDAEVVKEVKELPEAKPITLDINRPKE